MMFPPLAPLPELTVPAFPEVNVMAPPAPGGATLELLPPFPAIRENEPPAPAVTGPLFDPPFPKVKAMLPPRPLPLPVTPAPVLTVKSPPNALMLPNPLPVAREIFCP